MRRFFIASLLISSAFLITLTAPKTLPDNVRRAAGIAPSIIAYIPFMESSEKNKLRDVSARYERAPGVVWAMAIGIALDHNYPVKRVENLDLDLLTQSYQSDFQTLGGLKISTQSSILRTALKYDRDDIVLAILARSKGQDEDAQRLAFEVLRASENNLYANRYLTAYAQHGGSAEARPEGYRHSLVEEMLSHRPDLLHFFIDQGYDLWAQKDITQLSLAGRIAMWGDSYQIKGLAQVVKYQTDGTEKQNIINIVEALKMRQDTIDLAALFESIIEQDSTKATSLR